MEHCGGSSLVRETEVLYSCGYSPMTLYGSTVHVCCVCVHVHVHLCFIIICAIIYPVHGVVQG